MTPLCITADDYGLDAAIDRGIEELAEAGAISAVSVMAHADAHLDPAGLARLHKSGVAVGIHLVLVEERPLSAAAAALVDGAGRLPATWKALFARVVRRPASLAALAREAEAQVARHRALGLPLSFINSHQHVHLWPPIWLALAPLFDALGAPVRLAHRLRRQPPKQALVELAARTAARLRPLARRRVLSPVGIDVAGRMNADALRATLGRLAREPARPDVLHELVVHPGHEDAALRRRYGHWRYAWQAEYELFASDTCRQILRAHDLEPRFFHDT